jgi:putative DNA primase/helicase
MIKVLRQTTETTNQALILDSLRNNDGKPFEIVTEAELTRLLGRRKVGGSGVYEVNGRRVAARLKRGMQPSVWVLLDADAPEGMPDDWKALTLAERLARLEKLLPGISSCERVELRSSSARVVNGSGAPGDCTHALIRVSHPSKIEVMRAHLQIATVNECLSFPSPRYSRITGEIVGHGHRTLIDLAVFVPGRFVFNAKPDVSRAPGCHVINAGIRVVNPGGGALDIGSVDLPDQPALVSYKKRTGTSVTFSKGASLKSVVHGELKAVTEIEIRGLLKTLIEWTASMKPGNKLRCETPFRASSSEAAFIAMDKDGSVFLHDVGTSTTYPLTSTFPDDQNDDQQAKSAGEDKDENFADLKKRAADAEARDDAPPILEAAARLGVSDHEGETLVEILREALNRKASKAWLNSTWRNAKREIARERGRHRAADGGDAGRPPRGFHVVDDWMRRRVEKDGVEQWEPMCAPIEVTALSRSETSENWGRCVRFNDADGSTHHFSIPASMLAGDPNPPLQMLADAGLTFADSRLTTRQEIVALLQRWTPPARVTAVETLGWSPDRRAFLFGDGRVLGDQSVVFQTIAAAGAAGEMRVHGTLDEWRSSVSICCLDNTILIAAVSTALAGPLLDLIGMESGGVHLFGKSSEGKTTAQLVAGSVWGSPRFKQTWRATSNGLEGVAAACNSTCLVLDEISEISGKEAGAAAYMLGNGHGKVRADRSGAARRAVRWRLMYLSSGEMTLADKVAEGGGRTRAGHEMRLLNISVTGRKHGVFDRLHGAANGASFAGRIGAAAAGAYGTAGPAFVEFLMADQPAAIARVRAETARFEADADYLQNLGGADGQVLRALGRFAVIAAAGEVATEAGITGWPAGAARFALYHLFEVWLAARGGTGAAEDRDAVDRVRAFLVAHGDARFQELLTDATGVLAVSGARVIHDRAGWKDQTHFWIAADVWSREVHAGFSPTQSARALFAAGLLVTARRCGTAPLLLRVQSGAWVFHRGRWHRQRHRRKR